MSCLSTLDFDSNLQLTYFLQLFTRSLWVLIGFTEYYETLLDKNLQLRKTPGVQRFNKYFYSLGTMHFTETDDAHYLQLT